MYGWKIDGVLLGIEQLGATATFKNGNLYIDVPKKSLTIK